MPKHFRSFITAACTAVAATAAPVQAQTWPFPSDMSPTFEPRFIDISITDAKALGQLGLAERAMYGLIGLYAYCETANGLRAMTPSGAGEQYPQSQPQSGNHRCQLAAARQPRHAPLCL